MVNVAELKEKWKHLCLPEEQLNAILQLGNFGEEVEWMKFLALGCSMLGKVRMFTARALISKCKLSYVIIYELDHRKINANELWGMVIAFAAAGKAACMFTSVPHQLLVRGT